MNSKSKFYLFLSFILISIIIAIVSGYLGTTSSAIETFISTNHPLAAFIYNVLFIALTSFSFSISIMIGAGILFFSKFEIVVYAMIGIMGSSIIDFYISRKLGRDYLKNYIKKRGGNLEKLENVFEKDTFRTILILSAVFFVPPAIPNFLGGIMKINLKKYSIATFLGNLPTTIFTVYLLAGIFFSNQAYIYISIAGIALTALISLYFYKGQIKDLLVLSLPGFLKIKIKI